LIDFFYNIIIYPLVQIISLIYLFVFRIFENPGIALIGVSFAVSVLTLPLYFEAEKWRNLERETQKRLAPKIAKIKAAFKGDEQYLILSVFYRQNHYHPIYALRSSIGLLLQIPFFMAAFSYLSHLDTLQGTPFIGIPNLGAPDGLLRISPGGSENEILVFNMLPIIMTLFNISAAALYTKGQRLTEKIQLLGMAAVFFILLYDSPSGLVLYWTCNNLFSLVKNCLQKTKHAKNIVYAFSSSSALLLIIFVLFFHHGALYKRLIITVSGILFIALPVFVKEFKKASEKFFSQIDSQDSAIKHPSTIIFSSLSIFLLAGILISSSLIASSTEEFSFIESYTSPFPFILNTAEQAFGIFVFWVFCVYFLLPRSAKYILTILVTFIFADALLNTFIFSGNYGFLTIEMQFSEKERLLSSISMLLINLLALPALSGVVFFLLYYCRRLIIQSCLLVAFLALFATSSIYLIKIYNDFRPLYSQNEADKKLRNTLSDSDADGNNEYAPVYNFSRTGKNILVIMLDRALPGFMPFVFSEKSELYTAFSGFTFFPNTISFGSHTMFGAPALFGGYEYSPAELNARINEILVSKHNESFLVLPGIFSDNGYDVTTTDPPLYHLTLQELFSPYSDIKAAKIMGSYTQDWLNAHPEVRLASISALLRNRLIYLSLLKCAPLLFRHYIYDDGRWLASENGNTPLKTIESYSMLDVLPKITGFIDKPVNTFTMLVNNLTHEPAFLQAPDYTVPEIASTDKGKGPFALDYHYHINTAAMLLLGKWFGYLKENGVYDNTRIIIVSDHGINAYAKYKDNIILPTGECLEFDAALLMFKDFAAQGELAVDEQFMVNADTPLLATKEIIANPVNPFTGKKLKAEKDGGVTITSSQNFTKTQPKYQYDIGPNEWLHVRDSVFRPENWKKTSIK
jgi:YidC/Oxa1 family membrane protein insertase